MYLNIHFFKRKSYSYSLTSLWGWIEEMCSSELEILNRWPEVWVIRKQTRNVCYAKFLDKSFSYYQEYKKLISNTYNRGTTAQGVTITLDVFGFNISVWSHLCLQKCWVKLDSLHMRVNLMKSYCFWLQITTQLMILDNCGPGGNQMPLT